jgi:SAM-dependent methyltransferase
MSNPKFGLHAERYRRYRPGYPDAPFDWACAALGERRRLAVELGAGSGQATPQILKRFERVVAVEPDADMAGFIPLDPRLEVRVGRAEDVDLGREVDALISCTAFHWMDPVITGRRAAEALRPGGVFLALSYGPFRVLGPEPATAALAAEYEQWRPHMDTRLSTWRPYEELMAQSGAFASVEPYSFSFETVGAPGEAAGLALTTSYASAYARATGDETAYLADFARRLGEAVDGAPVTLGFEVTGAMGRV